VGVIGAGWIAETHMATISGLPHARVLATADVIPGRADYVDWRMMLAREQLDALLLCTPPDLHREPALEAAAAGLPFYLEKPVAHTLKDGLAIRDGAAGVISAVGYQYRALDFLADLPPDPQLLIGTGVSPTKPRAWFGDSARGGSIFLERASHLIDLERALGGEVASVAASAVEHSVALSLRFEGGALGTVVVANALGPGWRLELAGAGPPVKIELGPEFVAGELRHLGPPPIERSLAGFIEAVRYDDPDRVFCSLTDGVATLAVALAAEEAAAGGRTVDLSERAA
jgi:predicted dehydrogenase